MTSQANMSVVGNVQSKIPCLFDICIVEGKPSKKISSSSCEIYAVDSINPAVELSLLNSVATEKIDGTSCYVREFEGKPWLWIRHDQKPTKSAEKRFKNYKRTESRVDGFQWDVKIHLKPTPNNWIPMLKVERNSNGDLKTTSTGHIPGWVPVDPSNRSHCWHLSALDLSQSLLLLLRPSFTNGVEFDLCVVQLETLENRTLELIGTHINGNPYKLGCKNQPFHVFIEHGAINLPQDIPLNLNNLKIWFETSDGQVEGIVWHAKNGQLFKIHRHHLNLPWPISEPRLRSQIVQISISGAPSQPLSDHLIDLIISHSSHPPIPFSNLLDELCGK